MMDVTLHTKHLAAILLSILLSNLQPVVSVPIINSFDKVVLLSETVNSNTPLSTIDCTDDAGAPTNTVIQSVTPNNPCGSCFEILTCGANECLQYRAGIGTLNAEDVSSYAIVVACGNGAGDPPATELVDVKINANQPPFFNPDTLFVATQNTGFARNFDAGDSLYRIVAQDDDPADTVQYFLQTFPAEYDSMFRIGPTDGIIRPTVDMATVCTVELTFEVTIYDGKTFVGPKVVAYTLVVPNIAPTVTNLNNEVHIPEDATGTVFTMLISDRNPLNPAYTFSSTNPAGLAQYTIDGSSRNIGVAGALDYENANLRETDVRIRYTDGFCTSDDYNLKLVVKDVNEPPVITPVTSSFQVCEGQQFFNPGLTATDQDVGDTLTWGFHTSMANNDGFFNIERNSGIFMVNPLYDVDQNRRDPTITYVVQVEDKGKLSATATVNVEFLDCNDNAPVFNAPFYDFTTTACTAAGTNLGTVAASDDDSTREDNNVITFSGSGGAVMVNSAGGVILQSPLAAGTVLNFNALATDQGKTPGPLTSREPARVSVIFTECPTTQPPVTVAPATAATAAPITTTTPLPPNSASLEAELPWIIVAAILGAIFLGLFSFICWKFGSLLRCPSCNGPSCRNPCKRKPKPRKIEPRGPHQKPASPPPPVEDPVPGFIFGFWKERYPDNDFKCQPDRRAMPETGDLEPVYPHTIDHVDEPGDASPSGPGPQKSKRRCCNIL